MPPASFHTRRAKLASIESLDAAVCLISRRPLQLTGRYLIGSGPMLAGLLLLVWSAAGEQRDAVGVAGLLVAAGFAWRCVVLTELHRYVLDMTGQRLERSPWRRTLWIAAVRINAEGFGLALSMLYVPALLGVHLSSVAVTALAGSDRHPARILGSTISLLAAHLASIVYRGSVLVLLGVVFLMQTTSVIAFAVWTLLPNLVGIETTDAQLILMSPAWILCSMVVTLAAIDLLINVSGPMLAEQMSSRRSGSDLFARLASLEESSR